MVHRLLVRLPAAATLLVTLGPAQCNAAQVCLENTWRILALFFLVAYMHSRACHRHVGWWKYCRVMDSTSRCCRCACEAVAGVLKYALLLL